MVYTGFIAVSLGRVAVCREIIAIFGAGMAVSTTDMAIFPESIGQPGVFVGCPAPVITPFLSSAESCFHRRGFLDLPLVTRVLPLFHVPTEKKEIRCLFLSSIQAG
ncbi:hypothetical protein [Alkalicoccus urumqiensis]|uniref:hypothetical protein n=1 Tax=Alkalicoccus urumqiensis TaxID=1548213 RepID=UPI0015E5AA82|nr:hypothetical protein [Alkalicoccus urumqiensis]